MDYTLSAIRSAFETLQAHLLGDRSREQMAVTLCGVNRLHREVRLLVRDVILLPADAFCRQSAAYLEVKPEVQSMIHQRAYRHGLVQVDWHSHPGGGSCVGFSSTDDEYEAAQAAYLAHRMAGVPYGSVVVNDGALDARLWIAPGRPSAEPEGPAVVAYRPTAHALRAILVGGLERRVPASTQRRQRALAGALPAAFDRQVRAFGVEFQRRLGGLRVGLVGAGGLGSALAEQLSRLGVQDWVVVDPDVVDETNLNRLVNATVSDAQRGRSKVYLARSTIRQVHPKARVRALRTDVFDPAAQRALKACDLLLVATDNHSSRMAANRLAVQYLIPLLHVGFHIGVEDRPGGERVVTDVSGEFVLPDLGRWCLQCAGIVDPQAAGWELAPAAQRESLRQRGYVSDTPAPAVRHLDGLVAALATAEVHNLVHAFKPLQRYLVYDAMRGELLPLQVKPGDGCPVCSSEQGVLGLGDLEPLPDYRRAARAMLPPVDIAARFTTAGRPADPQHQLVTPRPVGPAADNVPARRHRRREALVEGDPDWP